MWNSISARCNKPKPAMMSADYLLINVNNHIYSYYISIIRTKQFDHITPVLASLHWLPVKVAKNILTHYLWLPLSLNQGFTANLQSITWACSYLLSWW